MYIVRFGLHRGYVMKKVNIGLKEKTHMQAKIISVLKGQSLNRYIEEALEKAIEKDKHLIKELGK